MKKRGIFILVITFTCIAVVIMVSLQFHPVEKLLRTPNPYGENALIQQAFEQNISGKYILKNVEFGNNYAAYNCADIDNDGTQEVIITYCETEKGDNIKISLLDQKDGLWNVITDISTKYNEVEFIEVLDFNNNNSNEIIIGMSTGDIITHKHMYICDVKTTQENIDINLCYESDYSGVDIADINNDGTSEIILADIPNGKDNYNLSVLERTADGFKKMCSADVNENLDSLLSVKAETDVENGIRKILLDGYITENSLSTFCYGYNTESNELYEIVSQ